MYVLLSHQSKHKIDINPFSDVRFISTFVILSSTSHGGMMDPDDIYAGMKSKKRHTDSSAAAAVAAARGHPPNSPKRIERREEYPSPIKERKEQEEQEEQEEQDEQDETQLNHNIDVALCMSLVLHCHLVDCSEKERNVL